ncbi:hypothetical protein GCM10027031_19890 [Corynebacterium atrinae]
MHRLGDEVLPQHGADGPAPVATPGEWSGPGAFDVEVPSGPSWGEDFAEEECAAVAKLG